MKAWCLLGGLLSEVTGGCVLAPVSRCGTLTDHALPLSTALRLFLTLLCRVARPAWHGAWALPHVESLEPPGPTRFRDPSCPPFFNSKHCSKPLGSALLLNIHFIERNSEMGSDLVYKTLSAFQHFRTPICKKCFAPYWCLTFFGIWVRREAPCTLPCVMAHL